MCAIVRLSAIYIRVFMHVYNCVKISTILSLIAVMLSGDSGGVEFKVGLDGCEASKVLGVHLRV